MRTAAQWLSEYGESHQNKTNKLIHWICVPLIFFSITALLWSIKLPLEITSSLQLNVAILIMILTVIYYFSLSPALATGMFLFGAGCLAACYVIEHSRLISLWLLALIIFVAAWIGQFYGHNVEGKKPSFLKDIQFLLIGPMWLMSFIYKKAGIQF